VSDPGALRASTTRFAPAPTGRLHLGHVANALWVWGAARALGARVLLRVEDHDRIRCRPEFERALLDELGWLGFEPDLPPERQSERAALYAAALARLGDTGLVYPCVCTRREVQAAGDDGAGELRYSGTCRERRPLEDATPMRRVRLEREEISFDDLLLGAQRQVPAEQCGDLLAIDRDRHGTYQFAVAVDDLEQGVDLVVRGRDLLASTGRQIQLARLLGRAQPARFLHHPLILRPDGSKLSKSNRDAGIGELRAAGWSRERVLGEAAAAVGLLERVRPMAPDELPELAAFVRLRAESEARPERR
jgi:glutamyl-tRNA synthetase/glutamyl-Q tRNA(Asp) synthetase